MNKRNLALDIFTDFKFLVKLRFYYADINTIAINYFAGRQKNLYFRKPNTSAT